MKKIIKLILGSVLFVLLMAGAYVLYGTLSESYEAKDTKEPESSQQDEEPTEGEEEEVRIAAPDFTVLDENGNEVKLSDYIGKPVVIYFWSTGCPSCMVGLPRFDKMATEYGDEAEFLLLNIDARENTVEKYNELISESGYSFDPYYDTNHEASSIYGVYSIPRSLFITDDGYIQSAYIGVLNETDIRSNVDSLLNK